MCVTHSLQYCHTAVTPGIYFPEFPAVGQVDGQQIDYYYNNIKRKIPKTEWIQKVTASDPDYWDKETQILQDEQRPLKANMDALMQRKDVNEDVELRKTLPNQDGSFQKRSISFPYFLENKYFFNLYSEKV